MDSAVFHCMHSANRGILYKKHIDSIDKMFCFKYTDIVNLLQYQKLFMKGVFYDEKNET